MANTSSPVLIQRWQEAKSEMDRSRQSADDVMERVKLIDGTPVFKKVGKAWFADTRSSKITAVGYALACGFQAENGGSVTHQMVAMFSLAADVDRVTKMAKRDVVAITAGFEEGSAEEAAQKKLGDRYPTIQKAILSFF
jgi:hypothetical protein